MPRAIREGPHCAALLHRVTGAPSQELDAAIARLPRAERERLDALASEILDDVRDTAGVDIQPHAA
jgi:hypothetical protein